MVEEEEEELAEELVQAEAALAGGLLAWAVLLLQAQAQAQAPSWPAPPAAP